MNILHGWGMSGYLPYDGFNWLKKYWWVSCKFNQWKEPIGYILQVDLKYPDELHELHNDYPLAPKKLAVSYDMLSEYCKKLLTNMR